jgi:hypothetical protein
MRTWKHKDTNSKRILKFGNPQLIRSNFIQQFWLTVNAKIKQTQVVRTVNNYRLLLI